MRIHVVTIMLMIALFASGCASSRSVGLIDSAKSRFGTLDARRGYRIANRQQKRDVRTARFDDKFKTVPEVEANLDMRLRQRFEMGEPELDVEKAREVLASAILNHNSRVEQYASELAQWEADRDFFVSANPNANFSVPRPEKPELAVMANEIPMKINLRIGTKIDNANVTDFRTRQIPDTK